MTNKDNINYIKNKILFVHVNTEFNKNTTNLLNSVKSLLFNNDYNKKIKLPKKLLQLSLGNKYNNKIKFNHKLEILIVGHCFLLNCKKVNLPKLLKKISFITSIEYLVNKNSYRISRNGDLINNIYKNKFTIIS